MVTQTPKVGMIGLYKLSEQDVEQINRRRDDAQGSGRADRMDGVQVHFGNAVTVGQVFPMVVVRVWGEDPEVAVNGQVLLDGNDTLWVTSRHQGDHVPGTYTLDLN
jgi:hypothetical protein